MESMEKTADKAHSKVHRDGWNDLHDSPLFTFSNDLLLQLSTMCFQCLGGCSSQSFSTH